jgi:hypothetical protein
VGKTKRRRPLRRSGRRKEDNIKMELRGREWGSTDCINLVQDRDYWRALVKTVMDLWFQ